MNPFDLQINGYAGADFCAIDLTAEQLHTACRALQGDGVDSILATVITDTIENLTAKLSNLQVFLRSISGQANHETPQAEVGA